MVGGPAVIREACTDTFAQLQHFNELKTQKLTSTHKSICPWSLIMAEMANHLGHPLFVCQREGGGGRGEIGGGRGEEGRMNE